MNSKITFFAILALILNCSGEAVARPLRVVTTLPPLAWVVERVGGDQVHVESLLQGHEDPHYVDAMPSFVSKLAKADAVCFVGMELEDAWLPKVIERSGNLKIQSGAGGYCNLGLAVTVMDRPSLGADRSQGHIHGGGNPHWYLSLQSLAEASEAVKVLLKKLKPESASLFEQNQRELKSQIEGNLKQIKRLIPRDLRAMEYHKEFSYLFRDWGLSSRGTVEEKPGVPPSAAGIARARDRIQGEAIQLVLATKAQSRKILSAVTSQTEARILQLDPMPTSSLDPIEYNQKLAEALIQQADQKTVQ
jgi:zinc/manganese transport system substrate-binding protein